MKNLAKNIRPKKVKDIIGQSHLLSSNSIIIKMIENNYLFSIIFYGNAGIGKTTFAQCIVNELNVAYSIFNASYQTKKDLEDIINKSKNFDQYIIIIEEVHRLNKDKQDILLSILEENKVFCFFTTTENPYFVINPAIRSRCQILELKPVSIQELNQGLINIIKNHNLEINISDELLFTISQYANGDIRVALNVIDLLINLYPKQKITKEILQSIIQKPIILGSHYGDEYHNLKSAFHKSLRGSDVNASLHYLARLIKLNALDDISRRMLAVAYEDVGLANINLAMRVSSGIESCYRLGFPEANNILSSLCIQLALSPKSNTANKAIECALNDIDDSKSYPIPKHLWDSHYQSAIKLGVTGYKYPHDYKHHYVKQQYLPQKLLDVNYFNPDESVEFEAKLSTWLKTLSKL